MNGTFVDELSLGEDIFVGVVVILFVVLVVVIVVVRVVVIVVALMVVRVVAVVVGVVVDAGNSQVPGIRDHLIQSHCL